MKHLLLFSLFVLSVFQVQAQCEPDEQYRDSAIGVYPPPTSIDNPDGGITTSACINSPYSFTFTFKIPSEIEFGTTTILLDSIVVANEGAVEGLPEGMSYSCNPESCVFTPMDTLACLEIFGTPTSANTPGEYELFINTEIYSPSSPFPLQIQFPTATIPGADGDYILTVEEEGSSTCFVSTDDYISENIRISNSPNPFGAVTTINLNSQVQESLNFMVYDMLGQLVHQRQVQIFPGENNFDFDGTHLDNGVYTYILANQKGQVSRRMVISR